MQINDNIRDFPIWKFAVHNVTGAGVLFEQLISFRERKEIIMEKLSVSYFAISRVLVKTKY